jgi:hypothetical protein
MYLEQGGFLVKDTKVACTWQNHRLPQATQESTLQNPAATKLDL